MQDMFEELKSRGNNLAITRSIAGLVGSVLIFIIFYMNIFRLPDDVLERWQTVALVMCALMFAASIINWVRFGNNSLYRGIENYCKKTPDPEATMKRLEKTWNDGLDIKKGKIDTEYIIGLLGMSSKVIPLEKAVWAYKKVTTGSGASSIVLFVCFSDGKYKSIIFNDHGPIDMVLEYILANCPWIAVGYNKETEKLEKNKDMDGFRKYAQTQRS